MHCYWLLKYTNAHKTSVCYFLSLLKAIRHAAYVILFSWPNITLTLLSVLVLGITGWIVLHVVRGTLGCVGTRYRAVLLGYKAWPWTRLRWCKASADEESKGKEALAEEYMPLIFIIRQYGGTALPRGALRDSGLLIVWGWTPMDLILSNLILLHYWLQHYTYEIKTTTTTKIRHISNKKLSMCISPAKPSLPTE